MENKIFLLEDDKTPAKVISDQLALSKFPLFIDRARNFNEAYDLLENNKINDYKCFIIDLNIPTIGLPNTLIEIIEDIRIAGWYWCLDYLITERNIDENNIIIYTAFHDVLIDCVKNIKDYQIHTIIKIPDSLKDKELSNIIESLI